jgi:O-antigen/teichoic acid export membrane protein
MDKKKMFYDAVLNILATAIPLGVLQFIILPVIGDKLGDVNYGLVVTVISMTRLLSHPFGNALNNIRLLQNNKYKKYNVTGDFNILLTSSIIINTIVMIVGTIYYIGIFSFIDIILIVLISSLDLAREYLIVTFRLSLNYKAILVNNVILGIGYTIGLVFFYLSGYWQLIYIFGAGLSFLYIVKESNLLQEGFNSTLLFKESTRKSVVLFFSVIIRTALLYADKLILFPLMGPVAVSIYYTATILGKLISRIIGPISSVMLSYLAKIKKIKVKNFIYFLFIAVIICIIGYVAIIFISKPVLNFLYPDWASKSLELIYVTTATSIVEVLNMVIHPVVLRFNNINWQILISVSDLVVSITAIFILYNLFGLLGFCVGMLVSRIFKLILLLSIYFFSYRKIIIA